MGPPVSYRKIENRAANTLHYMRSPDGREENAKEVERKTRDGRDREVIRIVFLIKSKLRDDQVDVGRIRSQTKNAR